VTGDSIVFPVRTSCTFSWSYLFFIVFRSFWRGVRCFHNVLLYHVFSFALRFLSGGRSPTTSDARMPRLTPFFDASPPPRPISDSYDRFYETAAATPPWFPPPFILNGSPCSGGPLTSMPVFPRRPFCVSLRGNVGPFQSEEESLFFCALSPDI